MNKLMLVLTFLIGTSLLAQTALDPNALVNDQITAAGVYTVEAGQTYYLGGTINVLWDVTIQGPAVDWIGSATNPPVFVQTPADNGDPRDFFEIGTGGKLTVKNVLLEGLHSNGAVVSRFLGNNGGDGFIVDNVAFSDWKDFATRNQSIGAELSITNCVFINGVRLAYSPWGGFPLRMDVACDKVTLENNTVFNSGRLLGNSGPWHNAKISEMHCTYINQAVNGHEQRAYEMIQANNIFYNYAFLGRKYNANTYDASFTTWNYFADSKEKLDSISLYMGQNLLVKQPEILNWYTASGGDTVLNSLLWEHPDVDSFVTIDNNYKIGTNYAEFDPGFVNFPNIIDAQLQFMDLYWNPALRVTPYETFVDWRIPSAVTYDGNGLPVMTGWPVNMDLSYTNTYLQKAGTDGLPLGDLNWFPTKKAEFLSNRAGIVAALRDSIANAKALYVPGTPTPMITPSMVDVRYESSLVPGDYYLSNNYPNPFNPSTTIKFGLPQQAKVTLSVYNVLGQKVYEVVEQGLAAGTHSFDFNASNLSSGIYVYSIHANGVNGKNFVESKKMMLIK